MKTKQILIVILLLFTTVEVSAKGQKPAKSWQWMEYMNYIPFLKPPEPYKVNNVDNILSYIRGLTYMFEDDFFEKFYKEGGEKKVEGKGKRAYNRYFINKYGQDFEIIPNFVRLSNPADRKIRDKAIGGVTLISHVPVQDTSKIADLIYQYLNDAYKLKFLLYDVQIANTFKDLKATEKSTSVFAGWYGLKTGALKLDISKDGKFSNYFLNFRPALNTALATPNFTATSEAFEFDYNYGFVIFPDESGKFLTVTYSINCRYFHNLRDEDTFGPYERDRRAEFNLFLNGEAMLKKTYADYKFKVVEIPIEKVLSR